MKNIVKLTKTKADKNLACWIVFPSEDSAIQYRQVIQETVDGLETNHFEAGKVPFEELPEAVQDEVKDTLKAFDEVNVKYENSEFSVTTGIFLKSSYSNDEIVCGRYFAKNIFTEEERKQYFFETFGYAR